MPESAAGCRRSGGVICRSDPDHDADFAFALCKLECRIWGLLAVDLDNRCRNAGLSDDLDAVAAAVQPQRGRKAVPVRRDDRVQVNAVASLADAEDAFGGGAIE